MKQVLCVVVGLGFGIYLGMSYSADKADLKIEKCESRAQHFGDEMRKCEQKISDQEDDLILTKDHLAICTSQLDRTTAQLERSNNSLKREGSQMGL